MRERKPRLWAKYEEAVEFIAYHDNESEIRLEYIADQDMVILACDLFGRTPEDVAKDVLKIRLKQEPDSTDPRQIQMFEPIEKGGLKLER